MRLFDLFEKVYQPKPWNPKGVNPALLTFDEYYKLVNPKDKTHPSTAYDADLSYFENDKKADFPTLLRRTKINGVIFEIRLKEETRAGDYVHWNDETGQHERDEKGELIYTRKTEDDLLRMGRQPREFSIGVFHGDQCVGRTQDEWGALLIWIAKEYRGFGLGPIIGKMAWKLEPAKSSGGFTPGGYHAFVKIYREIVRDALTSGFYRDQIRAGALTLDRVKAIVQSAKLEIKPTVRNKDFSSNDPKDWVVMFDNECCVVIYDRKLKDVEESSHFEESMVKGYMLVRYPLKFSGQNEYGLVVQFGADTPILKSFLIQCAASLCQQDGIPLYVDPDMLPFVPKSMKVGEIDMDTGYKRHPVWTRETVNLDLLSRSEKQFRKSFDRYGEFHDRVLELAHGKFSGENNA